MKKYITKEDSTRTHTDLHNIRFEAVVIGASTGGMKALHVLLGPLSYGLSIPVIIVQHMHPMSDDYFVRALNDKCKLSVKFAEDNESIRPGVVYFANPDRHLLIKVNRTFSLSMHEKVNYARPSIDVLFESAVDVFGENLIGVILTGKNNDGSQGLKKIKERGGLTVVQNPVTAEAASMPEEAMTATEVDYLLPIKEIGSFLETIAPGQKHQVLD